METEVDVENKNLSIAPGMYANTLLQLASAKNVVTIPIEALVLKGRQETVYVLDGNNHVQIRDVAIGMEGTQLAEIKSGINAGDRVLIGGQDKYQQGEEINPVLAPSQASETTQETGGTIDMKAEENAAGGNS
jgi:multidrug efflux pump subunit AcrA (membrane-fusion protein)